MPEDARKFDDAFIDKKVIKPGMLMRILGVTPGEKLSVKNKAMLRRIGKEYMDRFDAMESMKQEFPDRTDELIDYAMRSGAPLEVLENLQEIEDEGDVYESIEDLWPDYPTKEDFLFNEDEY
jgi:hypothetical protein